MPSVEPPSSTASIATAREIADWLVSRIAAILEVEPSRIETKQSFTTFGLESLDAFSIAGELTEWLERDLSATLLWEYPTIDTLAQHLGQDGLQHQDLPSGVTLQKGNYAPVKEEMEAAPSGASQEVPLSPTWRALRPIQTQGTRPPFFCMHGMGGSMLWAGPLARLLGEEQPFYVFQFPVSAESEVCRWSIEEIAALYVRELCECQPHGPYYLGGLSLGGLIAYEMAQQLRTQGQEVAHLALLDTTLPRGARRLAPWKWLLLHGTQMRQLPRGQRVTYLRLRGRANRQMGLRQVGALADRFYAKSGRVLPPLFRKIYIMNYAAAQKYRPKPYRGAVTLLRAMDSLDAPYDLDLGWRRMVSKGFRVREVAGDHFTLTEEPHIRVLARQLGECLREAQESQAARSR